MNLFVLIWGYLKARPLNTAINVLLLALGIAVVVILMLFNNQLREKISKNARGIDLVVGAKGSPLQLILCNIFHIDFPTGNIKLADAEKISRNRLVKKAIPMALGDSYEGFRIIGTNRSYPDLYQAVLSEGQWWEHDMEVTIGNAVSETLKLKSGDTFTSTHGLTSDGHAHDSRDFVVKGVFTQTHSVIDNLILTNVASVWAVHESHGSEEEDHTHRPDSISNPSRLVPGIAATDSLKEITSMLIQYRSPMGAIQLPRYVNSQSSLQAASPAFETARLFSILGVGIELMSAFAAVLIFISALSIFIALYNSLKERKYDLAIMRTMGATRAKLVISVLMESAVLTLLGAATGLLIAHGLLQIMSQTSEDMARAGMTGLIFYQEEWIILGGSLLLGIMCAIIPAIQAYKTDISKVLSGN
jgi:putative ABC transport system permease protein